MEQLKDMKNAKRLTQQVITKHQFGLSIIACFLVILACGWGFMASTQVTKTTPLTWQPAQQVVEPALVQKVLKENFQPLNNEPLPDATQIKAVVVAADPKYFIFDFNTPKLCGSAGCLYSAYTTDGKNILSLMLKPQVPKGSNLFVQSSERKNGYPCLDVAQKSSNELVVTSHFCFESGRLILLNQSLSEVKS